MESTLEEAVVLSEEMVKSIELARNIEPKKQKEKSLGSCAGEQAEKVPNTGCSMMQKAMMLK
jgi:hypothetical protein